MDINDILGGGADLSSLMEQARKMQEQVQEAQRRAEGREVTGEAGGGMVRVTANGRQEIVKVEIDKAVADPADLEMLQDLITAACNAALKKAKSIMSEELGPMAQMLEAGGVKL